MLKGNAAYKVAATFDGIDIYIPEDITQYHKQREVGAMAQQIFSESGATRDLIKEIAEQVLRICNSETEKKVRTDVGVLMNNLLYRLQYPVDEHCSVRMGCILSFMNEEDPNKLEDFWTKKKMELAFSNPDAYTFFLTWGIVNTPAYVNQFGSSIDMEYFNSRREALKGLTLPM